MAVFLINVCKFNGCGITFPTLSDLIQHIEDTHIDYDPKVVEEKEQAQPNCLPLSYVLRFISEEARKDNQFLNSNAAGVELKRKLATKHHSYSLSSSNRSSTPTGSEIDDDEMVVSESEDSNDSWTTEEFSSEFIMRYGSRHSGSGNNGIPGNEKPFACPVPGCKKRYKNVNGIKYHSKNGHKKDGKVRKGYKCHCGKSYKTAQGLKNHALLAHNSSPDNVLANQSVNANVFNNVNGVSMIMQRNGSQSPSQSLDSLSPSSISNTSSSSSSSVTLLQHFAGANNNVSNGGGASACLVQTISNAGVLNISQQQYKSSGGIQHPAQMVAETTTVAMSGASGNTSFSPMAASIPAAAAAHNAVSGRSCFDSSRNRRKIIVKLVKPAKKRRIIITDPSKVRIVKITNADGENNKYIVLHAKVHPKTDTIFRHLLAAINRRKKVNDDRDNIVLDVGS